MSVKTNKLQISKLNLFELIIPKGKNFIKENSAAPLMWIPTLIK